MPKSKSLNRQEVFKAFWALCVQLADCLNADNLLVSTGLHCAWRRHSLVIYMSANGRQLSVHRRKNVVLCTVSGEKANMWKAQIMPAPDGSAVFVANHAVLVAADAANALFGIITAFCKTCGEATPPDPEDQGVY